MSLSCFDRIRFSPSCRARTDLLLKHIGMADSLALVRQSLGLAAVSCLFEHEYPGKAGLFGCDMNTFSSYKPIEVREGGLRAVPFFLRVMGAK